MKLLCRKGHSDTSAKRLNQIIKPTDQDMLGKPCKGESGREAQEKVGKNKPQCPFFSNYKSIAIFFDNSVFLFFKACRRTD